LGKQHDDLECLGKIAVDDGAANFGGIEDGLGLGERRHGARDAAVLLLDGIRQIQRRIAAVIEDQDGL
jgi:hypothetical protein